MFDILPVNVENLKPALHHVNTEKEHILLKVLKSLIKKLLYRYYCSTCCFKNEKKNRQVLCHVRKMISIYIPKL